MLRTRLVRCVPAFGGDRNPLQPIFAYTSVNARPSRATPTTATRCTRRLEQMSPSSSSAAPPRPSWIPRSSRRRGSNPTLRDHAPAPQRNRAGNRPSEEEWAPRPKPLEGRARRRAPCSRVRRWSQHPRPYRHAALGRRRLSNPLLGKSAPERQIVSDGLRTSAMHWPCAGTGLAHVRLINLLRAQHYQVPEVSIFVF